ncbi:MAG: head decoration protein [Chloroflexi bacterium]|nr:head decoration protein [Chloroflexota bacterium]|tara:strand:+ start:229 stop:555 length:327 start_codon:yes stop_codon:yes gene_type:complete
MATKTETQHTASFIVSEANGNRSREEVTIKSGQNLAAGTVIGLHSGGDYAAYDDSDPASAYGILIEATDASSAAKNAAVLVRDAEVVEAEVTGEDANAKTDLASIIWR